MFCALGFRHGWRRSQTSMALIMGLLTLGCTTPRFLSKNTINQGQTVADIHQQQVLDHLAKFVHDRSAMPSFAHVNSGITEATDTAQVNASPVWLAGGFDRVTALFNGTRAARANWTMIPTTDPRRLELMRCAFQKAVANCGQGGPSDACPDCTKRFNSSYVGAPYKTELVANPPCCKLEEQITLGNMVPIPGPVKSTGTVNSECLNPGCCQWFGYGCKKCVPEECDCIYVGSYCGTYVWVTTSEGRDELAKLTLAILDYAQRDPRSTPSKDVVAFLTEEGVPTTYDRASIIIRTQIDASNVSFGVLNPDKEAKALLDKCRLKAMEGQTYGNAAEKDQAELQMNELRGSIQRNTPTVPDPNYLSEPELLPQGTLQLGPGLQELNQQLDQLR